MKIVITAGGTSEYIDSVRKITNSSSGKLGSIIANKLINRTDIEKIIYICSQKSIKPIENEKVEIKEIVNTLDLKREVEKILSNEKIDYFIHSMAVSDYTVDFVTNADLLLDNLLENGINKENVLNGNKKINNTKKISSYENNLILVLKKAPKIIGLIKKLQKNTKLIGFKLLNDVTEEELIDIANQLMQKNDCDYVVANDLKNITNNIHKAFIIDKNGIYTKVMTKEEIADSLSKIIK